MLKKLSLAALVAMGSMSFASASTDLSEAIKGTTIGGYLRYRYTANNQNGTTSEYKNIFKTAIKVSDDVTINTTILGKVSYKTSAGDNEKVAKGSFNFTEAYVSYNAYGVATKIGQQFLATPLSDHDDVLGNGILATYGLDSVTLAAAAMDSTNASSQNLYVLAAIANLGVANVQAWGYDLADEAGKKNGKTSYFVEASANLGAVAVKAQYAQGKAHSDDAKTNKFGALAVVGSLDVVNATVAYLNFGKNGSEVRIAPVANADALIAAGDLLSDPIQQGAFKDGWGGALVLSTKVDKFTPGVQYVHASVDNGDTKANEYDFDLAYQYTKKFKLSGYGAYKKTTTKTSSSIEKEVRAEAKYSF